MSVSRDELASPLMPTCATPTHNGISLTYSLPAKPGTLSPARSSKSPQAPQAPVVAEDQSLQYREIDVSSLPVLTVIKQHNDVIQSFLSFPSPMIPQQPSQQFPGLTYSSEQEPEPLTKISSLLRRLRPVPLSQIPADLLSRPPPVLTMDSGVGSPVPGSRMEDEDILDSSWSSNFDVPLYSHPGADWPKIPYGGQDFSNEAASPDSSFIDQSWDETQTLPLFEPNLDFDTCLMDLE